MPFLYVVKSGDYYKIGIANNVESRLASLQTGNPIRLELERSYEFANPFPVEGALHQKFGERHINGEWFSISADDLSEIDQICLLLGGVKSKDEVVVTDKDIKEANDDFESMTIESLGITDAPKGAWLERKYNSGKTLAYLIMRWRDYDDLKENGEPKRKLRYLKRLGGEYERTPMEERVNRTNIAKEMSECYVVGTS